MKKKVTHFLKKIIKILLYSRYVNLRAVGEVNLTRDEFDRQIDQFRNQSEIHRLPISVIYRVKNGGAYLRLSLESVAYFAKEIVLIDNGSEDRTREIFETVANSFPDVKFQYVQHDVTYARAGENYLADLNAGFPPLSEFYEFAFSHGNQAYLMKMDAHYLFLPAKKEIIERKINKQLPVVKLKIIDVFGRNHGYEPLLFQNKGWYFVDSDEFEVLKFDSPPRFFSSFAGFVWGAAIIHLKRLVKK
ncbi:glycosyltransferase [Alcanivorax sp.]|uniref:glycosyltransferase family 2 protein n=1 Tax=Alcanivorax sp. TaxID=1872427 RepID=UPI0025C16062|nr:glycosyltransferase [Alcanivorax sp.]